MTAMACCDSYQQCESVGSSNPDGDWRVAAVVMALGPELLQNLNPLDTSYIKSLNSRSLRRM
jgi:hypothetical protein